MGIDNSKDKEKINDKISSYKTVAAEKKRKRDQKRQANIKEREEKKAQRTKTINEAKEKVNDVADNLSNQLKDLFEIYKEILPSSQNINNRLGSLGVLGQVFMQAADNTKSKIAEILIEEILSTIGCSENQTFDAYINVPIYIDVKSVDIFKILKKDPSDPNVKFSYEKADTQNGDLPYSMNRELYKRLQSNLSFQQEYGSGFIGTSGQQLFDIQYVTSYVNSNQQTINGDFFKITLLQQTNIKTVSNFLFDYFTSIEIFNLDTLSANILNYLLGCFNIDSPQEEVTDLETFITFLLRIMGICTDPSKKIDVSGTAKIPELDTINEDFFEVSNLEKRNIENRVNLIINGLVEFESCDSVLLPVNQQAAINILNDVISFNDVPDKINGLLNGLGDIANDDNWQGYNIPTLSVNAEMLTKLILNLPHILLQTILSPKVMLGFLIMVKSILYGFDIAVNNLTEFIKKYSKLVVNTMRRIFSIFVEELFLIIKKEIKKLVESLLLDIVNEAKDKQIAMYSTIVYVLLQLGQAVIDYRNCKSVLDEILKLLNLGLSQLNLGLPMFALAASRLLGGVSDTRAYANAIENLQKAGIPTDDNGDGTPNLMNQMMEGLLKGMNKEQAENGKTEIYIPPLTVVALGAGITKAAKGYGKSY
jgi:hypothetical protein